MRKFVSKQQKKSKTQSEIKLAYYFSIEVEERGGIN